MTIAIPIALTGAWIDTAKLETFNSATGIRLILGVGLDQTVDFTGTPDLLRDETFVPLKIAADDYQRAAAWYFRQSFFASFGTLSILDWAGLYLNRDIVDDIVVRTRAFVHDSGRPGLLLRCTPESGGGYHIDLRSVDNKIRGYELTNFASAERANVVYSFTKNSWYYIQGSTSGSTIKAKVWKDGDAEPTSGGPDGDGYQLKWTDASHPSGKIGLFGYAQATNANRWTELVYPGYDNTSPPAYLEFDSGKPGSIWAEGITTKENIQPFDGGTALGWKVFYTDERQIVGNAGDRATIDAGLSGSWVTAGSVPGGTGRYRYLVPRFVSDGSASHSLAIYDNGQNVELAAGGASIFKSTMIQGVA